MSTTDGRLWDIRAVRDFVKSAKARVGSSGWAYLSRDMQEGLIASEFAAVLLGNRCHDLPGAAVQTLYADMMREAGLMD